jgi:hypothetical protein
MGQGGESIIRCWWAYLGIFLLSPDRKSRETTVEMRDPDKTSIKTEILEIWKPGKWQIKVGSCGQAAAVEFREKDGQNRVFSASTSSPRTSTWRSRSSSRGREGGLLTWRGRRREEGRYLRRATPTRSAPLPTTTRHLMPAEACNQPEAPYLRRSEGGGGKHKSTVRDRRGLHPVSLKLWMESQHHQEVI